jgi:predicted small integral membrane protein
MLSWMAWTWPTAGFFIFIFSCIVITGLVERRSPGGAERDGILRLRTTRGDRLFISILGSILLCLGWIGLFGLPVWGGLLSGLLWSLFVYWKV